MDIIGWWKCSLCLWSGVWLALYMLIDMNVQFCACYQSIQMLISQILKWLQCIFLLWWLIFLDIEIYSITGSFKSLHGNQSKRNKYGNYPQSVKASSYTCSLGCHVGSWWSQGPFCPPSSNIHLHNILTLCPRMCHDWLLKMIWRTNHSVCIIDKTTAVKLSTENCSDIDNFGWVSL